MRSLGFTFLLAFCAALLGGLCVWRVSTGNLDAVFGAPPLAAGGYLYSDFKPDAVHRMVLVGNGVSAEFERDASGWRVIRPWRDRMDPMFAAAIVGFTLGTKVQDVIPERKIDSQQAGFRDGIIAVRLEDVHGKPLANYVLGRLTAWTVMEKDNPQPSPTVFIRPLEKSRKNYIYACTGDIHPLFKSGFAALRDHRPFFFNPLAVQRIRIKGSEGELVLAKENPAAPWHITKPLALSTDRDAVVKLLEGLYKLRATKVSDASSVTRPSNADTREIAIQLFGSSTETVLNIQPPASPGARTLQATITDRPNAVFELPAKPEAGIDMSLAQIPQTVNELRDSTLTHLDIASIRSITIKPGSGAPPLFLKLVTKPGSGDDSAPAHKPKSTWMISRPDADPQPASEQAVFNLLKAVTEDKVAGFVTDAASNLAPWGLDHPELTLSFAGADNASIDLLFSHGKDGVLYSARRGSSSVVKLDETTISRIATMPYQWRQPQLWAIDRMNLVSIRRTAVNRPTILLSYDDKDTSWQCESGGKDVTSRLNPDRANYLLTALVNLSVQRWLAPDDPEASKRLANPALELSVLINRKGPDGSLESIDNRKLQLAPGPNNLIFYGQLDNEPNYFIIDRESVLKLVVDVLGDDS